MAKKGYTVSGSSFFKIIKVCANFVMDIMLVLLIVLVYTGSEIYPNQCPAISLPDWVASRRVAS